MNKKILIAVAALLAQQALPIYAQTGEGTVQVTVRDENGNAVDNAPVYIHGLERTHFVGGKEIPGTMVFAMKAGEYSFSSALAEHHGDYTDRFTSNEAKITVAEGENTSIIFTLKPIQDMEPAIAYAETHPGTMTSALAKQISASAERN